MRTKLLIVGGIILAVLAVVLGTRAIPRGNQSVALTAPFGDAKVEVPENATSRAHQASPADRGIETAQAEIKRAPNAPQGYNQLAVAFMQKARETGDFGFNTRAEAALSKSLKLNIDNYEALKLRAKLLLTFHRFDEALEVAQRVAQLQPRDYDNWGSITDALVELGRYDEARTAVQTMLDLRPYTASYARASYIASLYGDNKIAIEAMRAAAQSSSPGDLEGTAWCYVHLGDELLNTNQLVDAEREYDRALFIFPNYHLALAAKARARIANNDLEGALTYYKKAQERVPLPDTAIALGDLLTKLGRTEEARKEYALVEFTERSGNPTYSRNLASFWVDHDVNLDEALEVLRRERATRSDIYTNDALAWCLYKKGELAEAKKEIDLALRLKTRDPRILYHAGMIQKALGHRADAAKNLEAALKINPVFDVLQADVAKQALRSIDA